MKFKYNVQIKTVQEISLFLTDNKFNYTCVFKNDKKLTN